MRCRFTVWLSMPAPSVTPSRARLAMILGGLAMIGPFSIDTMFPAFPQIGEQFAADKVAMQQTISAYLFAYALMSLVHGPLSDAIGRKRVILGGLTVFTLASVGCALSTSLPMLLTFRALQGMSAGVGLIVGRAAIRDVFQGQYAQKLMSQVSMIFGIAPALAPIIGGWILGWERWPAIFWFLVLFSLLLLSATWLAFPETHPPEARFRPSPKQLLRNHGYIFLNRRFQRFAAAGGFNFAALFLYISSAPAFVLDHLKLQQDQFGWFFVPTIAGMVFGSFLSGRAAGRISGTPGWHWFLDLRARSGAERRLQPAGAAAVDAVGGRADGDQRDGHLAGVPDPHPRDSRHVSAPARRGVVAAGVH
jgi:MFS transporter, DHA1 family, multidrug resistance protein